MDLSDVYYSFSQTEEEGREKRLKKYTFGQIVKKEDSPCYLIEKGGRIITYQTLIDKISKKEIIGIFDYQKQKDQRTSYNSGNAICYQGHSAYKYPSGTGQGKGFQQGDVVQIKVNRSTSAVQYIINGTLEATDVNNILEDKARIYCFYVELCYTNDCIEMVMDD